MPTIEETLKRLAVTFAVRDIMIPRERLVCATDETDAAKVSADYPDFTVIPIPREGALTGYFERDTHGTTKITVNDLISDGTSLLDLVEFFEDREFAFVLSHRHIDGYVHFSDLNHHLVKLTFYVILEAVERLALDSLSPADDREYLSRSIDLQRFQQIERQYKRDGDAARSLFNYLNISDILKLGVKEGSIRLDDSVIKDMKNVRDGGAHALENLVADYNDVQRLANVKRECLRILGNSR
jgi:hypothetical protein